MKPMLICFVIGVLTGLLGQLAFTQYPVKVTTTNHARCVVQHANARHNWPCDIIKQDVAYVRFYH